MIMKNRYFARSHISEKKFREIIRYFSVDLTAVQIAQLTKLNLNTIHRILKKIRVKINELCEKESLFEHGEIELDESYFGAKRIRGQRGRGAKGKIIVFGLKKKEWQSLYSGYQKLLSDRPPAHYKQKNRQSIYCVHRWL